MRVALVIFASSSDDEHTGVILVILQCFTDTAMALCAANVNVTQTFDMCFCIGQ